MPVTVKAIAGRGLEDKLALFTGQDQCRLLFLQAKILSLAVEDFAIMLAHDARGMRVAVTDTLRQRLVQNLFFYIDNGSHGSNLTGRRSSCCCR